MTASKFVGQALRRKEDGHLLSGRGRFIADIQLSGMVQVAFARSPLAHARIKRLDVEPARTLAGVVAVYTADDLAPHLGPIHGMIAQPPIAWRQIVEPVVNIPEQPLIAKDVVRYVGEPFALIVAESRYIAEDAVELIEVEFEPLPAVTDPFEALKPNGTILHAAIGSNIVANFRIKKGDTAPQQSSAARNVRRRFYNHRFLASPIECRGVIAEYDRRANTMTVWSATQVVHWVRSEVARQLKLPEARVRCRAPDVGGGFGVKGHVYCEEVIVPFLARDLGRPVAWIEDRQEHLLNSTHSRDDFHDAELVFDDAGTIIALKDDVLADSGAFTPSGINSQANIAAHICGPYRVPHFDMTVTVVVTNKTPNAPYRGTGRPEGSFVVERLLDLAAHELGLDPVEIRLRNMIGPNEMPYARGIPYREGSSIVLDSGDYPRSLRNALDALGGLENFRIRQKAAWENGRYLGLGVASYVEGTGVGPFEGATIRIDPNGAIVVATGAVSAGQGHETVFAQVAADEWGVNPDAITIQISDTAAIAHGFGSIASRSGVVSSAAIRKTSAVLREKVLAIGAHLLECDTDDVEWRDGVVKRKGLFGSVSLKEIAFAAYPGWRTNRPPGVSAGLEATEYFEPRAVTWAYGTHAALVEIDADTGTVKIEKYVVAHDAGVLLNPLIAEGQVMGGICQGIGGVLLEKVVHDSNGQNLSGSLMDYLMPVAAQMPPLEVIHTETPSPLNELGVKGLGEGGVVGPPGAILNGVCDALRPFGFEANDSFFDQARVVETLAQGRTTNIA